MRAMILAAGFGTRLRPITELFPKPLIPVLGTPNIVRIIEHLKRYEIREIAINLHHLPDEIPRALGDVERSPREHQEAHAKQDQAHPELQRD